MNKTMTMQIPASIVIFGGTGDLAMNMLFPSLYDLFAYDTLPSDVTIYVYAHTDMTTEDLREMIKKRLDGKDADRGSKILNYFLEHIHYVQGKFDVPEDYQALKSKIGEHDNGVCTNKLFYLSVPPRFFGDVFTGLRSVELHNHCDKEFGWTRVVVEKPFGHDLESAQELEHVLHTTFKEEQVFHVDHYLCKDMVRNMISFRFSNTIFEPLWNKDYIEKVSIKMHEAKDVSNRGSFYDHVGAFRDVGQNHMLEMLSFVAMERPMSLDPKDFQESRARVVEHMSLIEDSLVRSQYEGYIDVSGVSDDSDTETFFHIQANINNERWEGVPFELSAGKALSETRAEIQVVFKDTPCLCPPSDVHHSHENVLTFSLKPEEMITLGLWTKVPGIENHITERVLSLPYELTNKSSSVKGAYSKVFFDAILGDQTLFKGQSEIYAGWKFTDKVMSALEKTPLTHYKIGETPKINQ